MESLPQISEAKMVRSGSLDPSRETSLTGFTLQQRSGEAPSIHALARAKTDLTTRLDP